MPKLIFPQLRGLYEALEPLAYTVLRVLAAAMMMQFGMGKVLSGDVARDIEHMRNLGLAPAAVMLFVLVTVMLFAVLIPRGDGYQLGAVWFGAFALIAARGGGKYSLDRLIGREF
ncbi:DoxX family protein [Paracoccus sp. S1E-3]|uniref:DoxX family protein n=1 Tax=Paracoccus sp. S1E-3 TaxID=2756130 RepID=UPI0015EEEA1C|nr:hypothetical protein [Paracoccus sp. S1E-3]MBA4489815.1 hypothetical protein [Paracoccus sp. S1E-3]